MHKYRVLFFMAALFGTLYYGCAREASESITIHGEALGTYYTVTIVPAKPIEEGPLRIMVDNALETVDALMSTYREDSELSRFNRHQDAAPFPLSPPTFEVFKMALEVSRQSDGAFDITVGPLVNAWGFGPATDSQPPDDATVARLLEQVGYEKLTLHPEGAVSKSNPLLYCDLSAIAKGFAVDETARRLEEIGIDRYMVEVGGEIRVSGLNARGEPWKLGIEKPVRNQQALDTIVQLESGALATSGNYRNYYELNGKTIFHTINPKTGYPIESSVASVSVIHDSCAMADAYATALMAMGDAERACAMAEKRSLAASLTIATDDTGGFTYIMTDPFVAYLQK